MMSSGGPTGPAARQGGWTEANAILPDEDEKALRARKEHLEAIDTLLIVRNAGRGRCRAA